MTPNGGILSVAVSSTTTYLYEYNSVGAQTGYFGGSNSSAAGEVPGGPFVTGLPGFAAQIGSTIYLVDHSGSRSESIDAFSTQGFYQGSTSNTNVSTAWFSPLQVSGSTVYFADDSNGGSIYSMSTSALAAAGRPPQGSDAERVRRLARHGRAGHHERHGWVLPIWLDARVDGQLRPVVVGLREQPHSQLPNCEPGTSGGERLARHDVGAADIVHLECNRSERAADHTERRPDSRCLRSQR